ncbi:MAG: putative Ig domain-containing protein [Pseudomonadota bacterium]
MAWVGSGVARLHRALITLGVLALSGASQLTHAVIPPGRFVNDLPECSGALFESLMEIDHDTGDLQALIDNNVLMARCTTAPAVDPADAFGHRVRVLAGTVNFESPHGHPLDLTPDGSQLLAVNTAGHRLEVFSVSTLGLSQRLSVPVGLDPVSVRARSNSEAWVVNRISDSISVVDLDTGDVVRTLMTANEPADVVFSAVSDRAFVSIADANQIEVYRLSDLDAPPTRIDAGFEEPRALAVSPDGQRVYAASFFSGSNTTALSGRPGPVTSGAVPGTENVVGRADAPTGGVNPVPNQGSQFTPALTAGNPGFSTLIVQGAADGAWRDDAGNDWRGFVTGAGAVASGRDTSWRLPDRDVAVINATTLGIENFQTGLMTMLMALDANPVTGDVTVVGLDSDNHRRFEPNLNGVFARVEFARFTPGQPSQNFDLNPHIDYTQATSSEVLRQQSVGDPRGVKWHPSGDRMYVTGMGSNNLAVLDLNGQRLGQLALGQGPTGIALLADQGRGFALNRFDGTVSEFSLDPLAVRSTTAFLDPTHESVRLGRPHLYDTHKGSGHGHLACASCHVDGRTDRLVWDLGKPDGENSALFHAMKSAMRTQPLLDTIRHPNMHWRGDRSELRDFLQTFSNLQAAIPINGLEIGEFEDFLSGVHFPPSPWRNEDNSLPSSVLLPDNPIAATGDAVLGRQKLNACIGCHSNNLSRSDVQSNVLGQNVIPPDFVQFYKRLGFNADDGNRSTSGFGFFHDGADSLMAAVPDGDILAALLAFDGPDNGLAVTQLRQDSHAALGRQHTVRGAPTAADQQRINTLIGYAGHPHLALVAKRHDGTRWHGYRFDSGAGFVTDGAGGTALTADQLLDASATGSLTVTLVMVGTERRIGVDRDFDTVLDSDDNTPPTLASSGELVLAVNEVVELGLNGQDLDGDSLTYQVAGLPEGLSFDAASGVIRGQVTSAGTAVVRATVSDGRDARTFVYPVQIGSPGTGSDGSSSGGLAWPLVLGLLVLLGLRRRMGPA